MQVDAGESGGDRAGEGRGLGGGKEGGGGGGEAKAIIIFRLWVNMKLFFTLGLHQAAFGL